MTSGPPSPVSEHTVSPLHSSGGTQSPAITPATSKRWSGVLKDLPKFTGRWTPSTVPSTPATEVGTDEYESGMEEKREKKRRRIKISVAKG